MVIARSWRLPGRFLNKGEDGTIAHAQLSFGNGMIMVGSVQDSAFGRLLKQPDEIGGAETQSSYVRGSPLDLRHPRPVGGVGPQRPLAALGAGSSAGSGQAVAAHLP